MSIGLRERKKQRQRQAIVDAAVGLFRERGFDQTRIQDILESAEISVRTFYNYFPGKEAVLDEYGASVIAAYLALARDELEARDRPVAERIRALVRASSEAFSADPAFMTVVAMRSRAFAGRGELPVQPPPIYTTLSQLFEEGQASGEIRPDTPPLELAQVYSGVFMYTVVSWLAERQTTSQTRRDDKAELEDRLTRAFDVFLDGCRTTSRTAARTRREPR